MFGDYCDLLDELLVPSHREDLDRYRKWLKYYSRIQLLFIDDFAISRYSENRIKILHHLIKPRNEYSAPNRASRPDELSSAAA